MCSIVYTINEIPMFVRCMRHRKKLLTVKYHSYLLEIIKPILKIKTTNMNFARLFAGKKKEKIVTWRFLNTYIDYQDNCAVFVWRS